MLWLSPGRPLHWATPRCVKAKEISPSLTGVFLKTAHPLRIRDGQLRMRVLLQGTLKLYLSEICQTQRTNIGFHLYEIPRIGKFMGVKVEWWLPGVGNRRNGEL